MTLVFRGDRYELGGGRVISIRAIPGKPGQHRLECGTCGESVTHRELFSVSEELAMKWIAGHETCPARKAPRRKK